MPLQIQPSNLQYYLPLDDHSEGTALGALTFKDRSSNGYDATDTDGDGDSVCKSEEFLTYP